MLSFKYKNKLSGKYSQYALSNDFKSYCEFVVCPLDYDELDYTMKYMY